MENGGDSGNREKQTDLGYMLLVKPTCLVIRNEREKGNLSLALGTNSCTNLLFDHDFDLVHYKVC